MVEYEELRIRAFKTGGDRYLIFANGPAAAAAVVTLEKPAAEYRRELALLFAEELGNRLPNGEATTTERARRLGRELFQTLLPEPILDCLRRGLQLAQDERRGLRLCFDVPGELMDIPFEILCAPPEDFLSELALQPALSVVRSLPGQPHNPLRLPQPSEDRQPISLVLVASTPKGPPPLQVEREIEGIRRALPPVLRAIETPLQVLGASARNRATRTNLQNLLGRQADPCAVVLIAHGGYDPQQKQHVVLLERDDGSPDPVPGHILRGLLTRAPGLRLVALNLCLGSRAAPREPLSGLAQSLLAGGVPAVVAMQMEVSDGAASVFSPALVGAICRNHTIDEAVSEGRLAAANTRETRIEWANPVLFLHRECGQGWLFKVREARAGRRLPDPLREGHLALERFESAPDLKDIPGAAFFLKQRRDWGRVLNLAEAGLDLSRGDSRYERLVREAEVELRVGELEAVCNVLGAEDDVASVRNAPATLRPVLQPDVVEALTQEIEQAGEILRQYREARDSEEREDWEGAAANYEAILVSRPGGFRDVRERLPKAREEWELASTYDQAARRGDGEWEQARNLYREILERRPKGYRDAVAAVAYAEGRIAEQQGNWAAARQAYQASLAKLPKEKSRCPDVGEREVYARGRAAEGEDEWAVAAEAYGKLKARYPEDLADAKERLPYARARAAEQALRWKAAVKAFAALDNAYRDVGERTAYARGRLAAEKGDWQGALDAFGALPLADGYRDGEVGRWRGFARAKLDEAAASWTGVVDDLRHLPLDFHRGEVAILRGYAEGRQAEAAGSWAQAAAAYERVSGDYRDAPARAAHARGRWAEAEERWAAAAQAFADLPEPWRDEVTPRRLYAEARAAEEEDQWPASAAAYAQLAAGFRDQSQRLPYACAREAAQKEDWQAVTAAAGPLPAAYRDTARLAAYAQGRLAEEREDWLTAAAVYESCDGYGDARERGTYARGRVHEDDGDWSKALAAWAPLPAQHRDVEPRRARLSRLLATVSWADGLASAGLAADPGAGALGLSAYAALREAGIHPDSPTEAIKEASFTLMEKGAMTPEARLAWDQLRSSEGRLRVDAFLYRLGDPAGLRRCLRELAAGPVSEVVAALGAALAGDAPLFLLLDNRREDAIAAWEALLAANPADAAAAHGLALAQLFRARELEASGAWEQAERAWQAAIAGWTLVLNDDEHWDTWRRERAERYQQPVTPTDGARLRSELGRELLDHLTDCADRGAAEGHAQREEKYRELTLALEVELEGARVLKEVGGLPLSENGGRPLVCGPLYLRHRGLGSRLGRRVAELEAAAGDRGEQEDILTALDAALGAGELSEETPRVPPATLFRLRCVFSDLGRALLLLSRHQPEQALRALPPVYQSRLAELPADCEGGAGEDHVAACRACRDVESSNPAYLYLAHRSARRLQDAVELAVRAHLGLAQEVLTMGGGCAEAFHSWQEAIAVSRNAGSQVRTKRAIVRVVLGRAQALAQERGRRRGERLTAALELVEQARRLIGAADEGQLVALAAELLTDRGVWYGYGCHEYEDPDYEKAAQDLRRALELTPDSLHARDNLSRALIFQAANLQGEPGSRGPLRFLAEAIAVLHEGLRRTAGHRQLVEMLRRGLDELEECVLYDLSTDELTQRIGRADGAADSTSSAEQAQQLAATAARRRAEGDETGELMALITAARRDAADDQIRQALLSAVQRRAGLEP